MAARREPGIKDYDGKTDKGPFWMIQKCQEFSARIFEYTSKAEKEYRQTICKIVQEYCCEMVHHARLANSLKLDDPMRKTVHLQTLEYIDRINDLFPVLRRCRCISPNQEADLQHKFRGLREGYIGWIKSDERRISNNANMNKEQG